MLISNLIGAVNPRSQVTDSEVPCRLRHEGVGKRLTALQLRRRPAVAGRLQDFAYSGAPVIDSVARWARRSRSALAARYSSVSRSIISWRRP